MTPGDDVVLGPDDGRQDEHVQVQIRGQGELGQIVAISDARGRVRGTVSNPAADLRLPSGQPDVARAIGRSEPNVSRLERAGANPQAASLLAYLEAVGADLTDLHGELAERDDAISEALEQQIAAGRARKRHSVTRHNSS